MRLHFCVAADRRIDGKLAEAFMRGCCSERDQCSIIDEADSLPVRSDVDVVIIAGVKSSSRPIFDAYLAAGKRVLFVDKGYMRAKGGPLKGVFWRVSIDSFQPHAYFRLPPKANDRLYKMGVTVQTERSVGTRIIFAGSSQEFCDWHGLGDTSEYARSVMCAIRDRIDLPVYYRPKPSWKQAQPIDGFSFSAPKTHFVDEMANAYALVTYGSNACFEALMCGVPAIVLGDGIARSLSSSSLDSIVSLKLPTYEERYQLACDVSYCQWTIEEIACGRMWRHVRAQLTPAWSTAHED